MFPYTSKLIYLKKKSALRFPDIINSRFQKTVNSRCSCLCTLNSISCPTDLMSLLERGLWKQKQWHKVQNTQMQLLIVYVWIDWPLFGRMKSRTNEQDSNPPLSVTVPPMCLWSLFSMAGVAPHHTCVSWTTWAGMTCIIWLMSEAASLTFSMLLCSC